MELRFFCAMRPRRSKLHQHASGALVLLALLLTLTPAAFAEPAALKDDLPGLQGAAVYSNGYDYVHCPVTMLLTPRSTAELAAAVSRLARHARAGRAVRLRASHSGFGSSASFPCPVQPGGAGADGSSRAANGSTGAASATPIVVGALLGGMDAVISVDAGARTMRVQAQMMLSQLYAAATAAELSVPLGIVPAWAGLTLAGIIASSAHGSGRNGSNTLCDMVRDITWVDGTGRVHVSQRHSAAGRGLCSGLGLLGVMTELTLQLEPHSNTRISTWHLRDDAALADDVRAMLALSPRLLVLWRPDVGRYSGYMLAPAPASAPADENAVCTILPSMAPPVAALSNTMLRGWQADLQDGSLLSHMADKTNCAAALVSSVGQPWAASLGHPILNGVGVTNRVQSVECGDECAWTSKIANTTIQDMEFTIEFSNLDDWVADVKRIIRLDLKRNGASPKRCLPPGFFVLRFGRPSSDLLSTTAGLRDPMYVQQITMRSKSAPGTPSKYEWVQETYEQLTLCKYKGRPHWGKCADRTFTNAACPLRGMYGARLDEMQRLQDAYDPLRLFEPQLYAAALAAGAPGGAPAGGDGPGCVLRRTCYCSRDEQCARGFACVPSAAFPEYRVCKPRKWL